MSQNFVGRNAEFFQFILRQINSSPFGIRAHVAQNVGELERFAQVDGVTAARGILVAENLDAQEASHRSNAIAVKFKLLEVLVTLDLKIHFASLEQFVEQRERKAVFADDRLKFTVYRELRGFTGARAANIGAPGGQ